MEEKSRCDPPLLVRLRARLKTQVQQQREESHCEEFSSSFSCSAYAADLMFTSRNQRRSRASNCTLREFQGGMTGFGSDSARKQILPRDSKRGYHKRFAAFCLTCCRFA